MSARVFVCDSCGRAVFPPRLLCDCGSRDFHEQGVDSGTLEEIANRGQVKLGTVRVPQGPILIVRLEGEPKRGRKVQLDTDGDIPVARA